CSDAYSALLLPHQSRIASAEPTLSGIAPPKTGRIGGVIEIRTGTDAEQAAVGLALVTGALRLGEWPLRVTRVRPGTGPGGRSGLLPAGNGTAGPTEGMVFVEELRRCCATGLAAAHRPGCTPDPDDRPVSSAVQGS